ncbi:MAG TPA: hypothetical protein VIM79_08475 [Niastella sp.]
MKKLLFPFLLFIALSSAAQKVKPNSSEFIQECMKNSGEVPNKKMVIWLPYNYWQIVGDLMKLSPERTQYMANEMSNYMLFAVVDYTVAGTGLTFKSEEEIRKSIKLVDSSKVIYLPLDNKDLTPAANALVQNLQPVIAQMLGQFGEGMRIFVFNAKQVNGKPAIEIDKANYFTLMWGGSKLKWTLPFASILPPKFCPVDNEEMKGNWMYCPFHGEKLGH